MGSMIHASHHTVVHRSQRCIDRVHAGTNWQRRQLLLSTAGLAATSTIARPTLATELERVYAGQQFNFAYPSSFVLAYDRERTEYGSLVAVANYNKYLTFAVERQRAPSGAAGTCVCTPPHTGLPQYPHQTPLQLETHGRSLPQRLIRCVCSTQGCNTIKHLHTGVHTVLYFAEQRAAGGPRQPALCGR